MSGYVRLPVVNGPSRDGVVTWPHSVEEDGSTIEVTLVYGWRERNIRAYVDRVHSDGSVEPITPSGLSELPKALCRLREEEALWEVPVSTLERHVARILKQEVTP